MANYATLKSAVQQVIKTNGNNEITGAILQSALMSMITSLGADYQFMGFALPATSPGTPDQNVAYIAPPGTYSGFGNTEVKGGQIGVFSYNGSWSYTVKNITEVVNNLGKGGENAVLSAEQGYEIGRILNEFFGFSLSTTVPAVTTANFSTTVMGYNDHYSIYTPAKAGTTVKFAMTTELLDYVQIYILKVGASSFSAVSGAYLYKNNTKEITLTDDVRAFGFYRAKAGVAGNGNVTITAEASGQLSVILSNLEQKQSDIDELKTVVGVPIYSRAFKSKANGIGIDQQDIPVISSNFILRVNQIAGNTTQFLIQKYNTQGQASNYVVDTTTYWQFDSDVPILLDPAEYPKLRIYAADNWGTVVVPAANTSFVLECLANGEGLVREIKKMYPLYGKTVVMFGDSMTQLPKVSSPNDSGEGIVEYFAKITKANVIRAGIGGTMLSRYVANPTNTDYSSNIQICSVVEAAVTGSFTKMQAAHDNYSAANNDYIQWLINTLSALDMSKVDIITIFGGTNDWTSGRNLGSDSDTSPTTIKGAINYISNLIYSNYPNVQVYFFTPVIRQYLASGEDVTQLDPAVADARWGDVYQISGHTLADIVATVMDGGKINHIPVGDLYWQMDWNKYNFGTFCSGNSDRTHPRRGWMHLAQKMSAYIISHLTRYVL